MVRTALALVIGPAIHSQERPEPARWYGSFWSRRCTCVWAWTWGSTWRPQRAAPAEPLGNGPTQSRSVQSEAGAEER